ncbi:hypothetical protein MalM25_04850 [Planctomycetes bacterium MalM25]|nr:hypothetical protein MalM25_04850 [Planctomycetes bacterium MalM25]
MDCDRVFAALTAGPFPTGAPTDDEVQQHLHSCPSCRRIAEALRPDDDLAHEALVAHERQSLPRYRNALSPVAASGTPTAQVGAASAWRQPAAGTSGWDSHFGLAAATQQVAAFTLAPRRRVGRWGELALLVALSAAVGLSGWGLGSILFF